MKPYQVIVMSVVVAVLTTFLIVPIILSGQEKEIPLEPPLLTHAQDTWMRALEWCESNGRPEAVNEVDLDGTPSYGAWQFKPSTLDYYADMYGVATTTVKDRSVQEAVLTQMIVHRNEIKWDQQFPWCVKKLGWPPKAE